MPSAPEAASPRIEWCSVPEHVRTGVEDALGSAIVTTVTQVGGFSPGAAVRVVCADGRRAFVKAAGSALNPDTPELNRAEIVALRLLPDQTPAPRLLSSYDDGDWVALVLEDVDGRRPDLPWGDAHVAAMARTLRTVAETRAHDELPAFGDRALSLDAWDDIAAQPDGIDARLTERLPEMREAQELARRVTAGDWLVHWDARADNVLIREGTAVLLDWAWASRGAPWLDTLLLAMDFQIQGGPSSDAFLREHPVTRDVPPEHLRAVVACMVGVWAERARHPAPPGLPTIREWQAHCRDHALRWLDGGTLWS
ncbi:MAG: phosphotransferase family protein [Actinomycetes bacterium]